MTHYGSLFFLPVSWETRKRALYARGADGADARGNECATAPPAPQRQSCLVGSLVIPDFCLNLITFIYTHILLVMQTFSLSCFSSSHRGGGVAPDCMDFALKVSFPWLQAPFRLRSGVFSHPEWVATQFNLFFYLREIEDFWGSEEDERSDRPTDTNRKTADFEADLHGRNF